jgi:hypothetical protein
MASGPVLFGEVPAVLNRTFVAGNCLSNPVIVFAIGKAGPLIWPAPAREILWV